MNYQDLVSKERVTTVLQELVALPSVNPDFPGGTGEAKVSVYVETFFETLKLNYWKQTVEPERHNIIGMVEGASTNRNILLESHMDTVQVTNMTIPPFDGKVENGKLYGRGACDTKGSLAAMLVALEILKKENLTPAMNIYLAAVVDEELDFKGVKHLTDWVKEQDIAFEAGIVGEPTNLNIVHCHKGTIKFKVNVYGASGHTSKPYLGINAIENMIHVLTCLKEMEKDFSSLTHPLLGPPTQSVTMIEGGEGPNTIPDFCQISIDRRTVPGEDPMEVWESIKRKLTKLQEQFPDLKLEVHKPFIMNYSLDTDVNEKIVKQIKEAAISSGNEGGTMGVDFGSDASYLNRVGISSVVLGPGSIEQAHTKDEWVEVEEVVQCVKILLAMMLDS